MSGFYKPHRKPDWNYGGPRWRLSRSKIDLFVECPRCFYIDNKLGTARPPGFPFNLNSAVDALLKKEFDIHRRGKTTHPLMHAYGLNMVPYVDSRMDVWRENFKGIEVHHEKTGFTVSGAVDDIWQHPDGTVAVVDYKATSKDTEVTLDAEWQDGYKRQMEIYQWLLRKSGLPVSDTGYFVYVNGKTDRAAFDGKLEFDVKLIPYTGNDGWVEGTLEKIHACLTSSEIPAKGSACDYCTYREAARSVMEAHVKGQSTPKPKKDAPPSDLTQTSALF